MIEIEKVDKVLGKIIKADFGRHDDYPNIGFFLEFRLHGRGNVKNCNTSSAVIGVPDEVVYPDIYPTRTQHLEAMSDVLYKVHKTLQDARVLHVSQLVGKPVEVTLVGNLFRDFRILTEVL